jgi:hypothetical protein
MENYCTNDTSCLNNGSCILNIDSTTSCTCQSGYTGKFCENKLQIHNSQKSKLLTSLIFCNKIVKKKLLFKISF